MLSIRKPVAEWTIRPEATRSTQNVVPAAPKRVVAWYARWVGTESGRVRQEMMVSQSHYMLSRFSEFDAPVKIAPPDTSTASPVASSAP